MTRRVAVIAVHGVGHHQPREAARAAADLLALTGNYEPFVESPLRIRVEALRREEREARRARTLTQAFDERPEFVRNPQKPGRHERPEIEYMKEQLSRYEPEDDDCVYETVVLKSTRKAAAADDRTELHVFDMYWTDLSRVGTAGLRMIGELYQLLFYVSGLGRHTLDFACDRHPKSHLWRWLAYFQRHAERLLVLWIPALNLAAAGLAIVLVPQTLLQHAPAVSLIAMFVIGYALAAWAWWRWCEPGGAWPAMFAILAAWGVVASLVAAYTWPLAQPRVLLFLSWILASIFIVLLMHFYGKRRPGAALVGVITVAAVAVMLLCPVIAADVGAQDFVAVGVRAGKWIYVALNFAWSAFLTFAFFVTVLGCITWRVFRDSPERRTIWTANLSITLPGLLVLILNLGLWAAALKLSSNVLGDAPTEEIRAIIQRGTPWTLGFVMALGIVAVFSIAWSMLPSLLGEVFPRQAGAGCAGSPSSPRGLSRSAAVGQSLSHAFVTLRFWGELLRFCVVILIPVSFMLTYTFHVFDPEWAKPYQDLSSQMTIWVGLALIGMIAGPGPLRALGMGLRTAIDVAIDVANWLRVYPLEHNPRAKICARFASLLQNIVDYGRHDGTGYDRILILSHSQGTVVASELLRYLHLTHDPLSAQIAAKDPVLFTMGCPLRQLYSQRFPMQYAWGRSESPGDMAGAPHPHELAVAKWANAYRSGDYVGRALWRPVNAADIWEGGVHSDAKGTRVEECIGAGAHTHYWDDTAPEVGAMLDGFVA